jgi:hypothetical protein
MAIDDSSLPLNDPPPGIIPHNLSVTNGINREREGNEPTIRIEHEDGSITIDLDAPDDKDDADASGEFYRNLALEMDPTHLMEIASSLLEGIKVDDESRKDWLETRTLGIGLLGLKLEKPKADLGSNNSAPLEGMSNVRHPLLLASTVNFQATARGELLPASGPVKVRNDSTLPPEGTIPELLDTMSKKDELAEALEKDMNHYLTVTATEYVPDTDRMLFYIGFGGDGFKKVYNCPLRRRPVSESIDAEDLIISNAATDLQNCGRVTHHIRMRQSTLRRMQILEVYRDVDLSPPPPEQKNPVEKKKEEVAGITSVQRRPEDRDYSVYECYCELDLNEYAPDEFKDKGLPLPYCVTIEKDSRQVLCVRRNWNEDDKQCLAKRFFVQFPFIRGLGFYGLGFIHLLGNTTNALTAAWREMLDAGMFANFPGFLFAKGAGRQLSNQFRVPPGGGVGLDIGSQANIRDAIMPLPYKEVGPSFNNFIQHVEEMGRQLASTPDVSVGEGKQDAPVGTTLALLEQASKVLDSAHKRLHAAQAEEFKLLKERFREDPEAFWRHNKKPMHEWKKEQFIEALDQCELVPVADPNNPTSLHRMVKAMALKELQKGSPLLYDPIAVEKRVLRIADIDAEGLFRPAPAQPPPDPRMEAIQQKSQAQSNQAQIQLLETKIKAATQAAAINDKAQDRASRERIEQLKIQQEQMKIEEERIIHGMQAQQDAEKAAQEIRLTAATKAHELAMGAAEAAQDRHHANLDKMQELAHNHVSAQHDQLLAQHEAIGGHIKTRRELDMEHERHTAQMERERQKHEQDMAHAREMHAAKLEAARALAKVKKSTKTKKD